MGDNLEFILKEFDALRTEILDRSKRQYTTLLWSLTLLAAIFATPRLRQFIYIIPFAFTFFGYLWLENYTAIQVIAAYIRDKIENKLAKHPDVKKYNLNWENHLINLKVDGKKNVVLFLLLHILYFSSISLGALFIQGFWIIYSDSPPLYTCAFVINLLLFCFLFYYSVNTYKKRYKEKLQSQSVHFTSGK